MNSYMKHGIKFSRLLKIFKHNNSPAYIIETFDERRAKSLYISFFENGKRHFLSQHSLFEDCDFFKNLSRKCLMDSCVDASYMFANSPIDEFSANCKKLKNVDHMFYRSNIKKINIYKNKTLNKSDFDLSTCHNLKDFEITNETKPIKIWIF